MKHIVTKFLSYVVLSVLFMFCFVGCDQQRIEINKENAPVILESLLNEVSFATPLSMVGKNTQLYFPNMPKGTAIQFYKSSGYYADEVGLFVLPENFGSEVEVVMKSIKKHLQELRNQFSNYVPEEVGKIDAAIVMQSGKYVFLCITKDIETATEILQNKRRITWECIESKTEENHMKIEDTKETEIILAETRELETDIKDFKEENETGELEGKKELEYPEEKLETEKELEYPEEKLETEKALEYVEETNKVPVSLSMQKLLFIGDSRTVGLAEFSKLEKADFFADIGMTVYSVWDACIPVPDVGRVTLNELLNNKEYDIIYIMLGINELGCDFEEITNQYKKLIDFVCEIQAKSKIILMGNLHVTQSRSDSDKYINNPAINHFNATIAQMTDNQSIFYLDANPIFDDKNGNLAEEKSADNAHLLAKYYDEWGDWVTAQTSKILGQ